MIKDDSKYLSQEFDSKLQQKCFYPYEYMSDFKKFKKQLPNKEKFYSTSTDKKNGDIEYEQVIKVCCKFEKKTMKDCQVLYLKCNV